MDINIWQAKAAVTYLAAMAGVDVLAGEMPLLGDTGDCC